MKRIALVTGANKGIGREVARQLAARGFHVLLGARDAERGEAAAAQLREEGLAVQFLPLDVTDDGSVARAAAAIRERHGVLDVLVNNAGVKFEIHPAPPSQCTLDLVRQTFETNVFGVVRVTLAMLPLLQASASARVVNVSSGLGSLTLSAFPGTKFNEKPILSYNVSKTAVNAITVQFANELRGSRIKFNAADPGYTHTDMTQNKGGKPVERGAGVIVRLATLDDHGPTGAFFDESGPMPW